jgi:hypothetical protein
MSRSGAGDHLVDRRVRDEAMAFRKAFDTVPDNSIGKTALCRCSGSSTRPTASAACSFRKQTR